MDKSTEEKLKRIKHEFDEIIFIHSYILDEDKEEARKIIQQQAKELLNEPTKD